MRSHETSWVSALTVDTTASAQAGSSRGLGLGLYIAKALIDAHSGRIWAESRPGQTTFQFALPTMR